MDCVFCKIAAKTAKSWVVYEDELVVAFLDVNPVSRGHTLIAPKKHYESIYEIDERSLERIAAIAKKLAGIYKKALGVSAVNLLHASGKAAQQSIFHFHMHLIPRAENDGLDLWFKTGGGIKEDFDKTCGLIKTLWG